MPLDGNGQYLLPAPEFPAIPYTQVEAAMFNAIMLDLEGALSQAFYRDGQAGMTGDLPMSGFRILNPGQIIADVLAIASNTFNLTAAGNVRLPQPAVGDATNRAATTAFVMNALQLVTTVDKWEPDVFYEDGKVVWSPITFLQYRRLIAGAGDTDPSLDLTNWTILNPISGFQVGDYLETVRTPDDTWLRRDGKYYPAYAYPELALLLPAVPSSFFFSKLPTAGTSGTVYGASLGEDAVIFFNEAGLTLVWDSIEEEWTEKTHSVMARSSAALFGERKFFAGYGPLLTSTEDYLNYTTHVIPGIPADTGINIAASPTALIIVGNTASNLAYIRRATQVGGPYTTITSPSFRIGGISYAKGLFFGYRPGSPSRILSRDDGLTFQTIDLTATPFNRIKDVNGNLLGFTGSNGLAYRIDDAFTTFTLIDDLPADVTDIIFVNGKYVVFTPTKILYSMDLASWTEVERPEGAISVALPAGDLALTGGISNYLKGVFIDSEAFAVPNDNPTRGWIKAVTP